MNEQHQLNVWTTALNLPQYEVVHFAQGEGVRHFSLVPTCVIDVCPECSKPCDRWHQKRWINDVVDLPLGDQPVRLKVRVFQYHCEHCDRMWTPKCLFLTPGMGGKATARFVGQAAEMIRHADVQGAAEFFGVPEKTLERWYYEWVDSQQEAEDATEPIRSLGIDELSLKKRHGQYVAVIVDHTNQRVLDVLESRDKDRVKAYFQEGLTDGRFAELEEVTCDMWDAYVNAAREVFGEDFRVTIDRFHVMKNFQQQLDQARREIQRTLPAEERAALKGTRWLWLQNDESLSPKERKQLKQLCQQYPQLRQLREQRERLRVIFEEAETGGKRSAREGQQRLIAWMKEAKSLSLNALDRFCQTLENWLELIANYFVDRSSNGPTEGFNNGLRSLLRRAFGMTNFKNFRARVLHLFGKPKPQESP